MVPLATSEVKMLKKRIGVIMYETSRSKGQELVAQRMVREFIKLGHEAFLITSTYDDGVKVASSGNFTKSRGFLYTERDHELGIPIIRVDSYVARWPPRRISFRDFISVLERIVDGFHLDVLITHSTLWNGPEETARFIEWRRYMKRIGGYRDPLVFCHMSHFQEPSPKRYSLAERSFRVAWNRLTLPQIFSAANLILVVTPLEKEAKVKMGAKSEKCFLYPGGIDDGVFERYSRGNAQTAKNFLRQFKIDGTKKIVSYLGSLEERKNPLGVLKVAEMLKERNDVHFIIAGKGDSPYSKKLVEAAQSLPNVTYVGELNEQQKVLLIKSSYLNILLSRSEALGLAQLEFMYSGVPVVTSGVEGQAWIVRDGMEGIHVKGPDDIEGATAAITKLVDNAALWNEMSANAKKRTADLTLSKLTEQFDEALSKELIKERGLVAIPSEVRATIAKPENVLKSWSSGSWGVIATGRRLFIRRGVISRKVTEIPYTNVTSIEHTRRYSWKTLVAGSVVALLLFIGLFLRSVLPEPLSSIANELVNSLANSGQLQPMSPQVLLALIPVVPLLIALIAFALEARTGFTLRGPGKETIYLPGQFREVITFIRNMQDVDFERATARKPRRLPIEESSE
jgi:glycosyltransferase involved in cell wall biosynthesis